MANEMTYYINPASGQAYRRSKGRMQRVPDRDVKRNGPGGRRRKRHNPAAGSYRSVGMTALKLGGGALAGVAVRFGVRKLLGTDGALSPYLPGLVNIGGGAVVALTLSPLVGGGMIAAGVYDLGNLGASRAWPELADDMEQEIERIAGGVEQAIPQIGPSAAKDLIDRFAAGSGGADGIEVQGLAVEGLGGWF